MLNYCCDVEVDPPRDIFYNLFLKTPICLCWLRAHGVKPLHFSNGTRSWARSETTRCLKVKCFCYC